MKTTTATTLCAAMAACLFFTGCPSTANNGPGGGNGSASGSADVPVFTLAWSEYPSWSVFGVADVKDLIDGEAGKQGPVEEKWGVDIVLSGIDYEACLQRYGSATCDAVCITNIDVLQPSLSRQSVAILPTSTSIGADACIVVGIENVEELRDHKVFGLEKSVSEYCFVRNLENLGEKESDHRFTQMDPGEAARAMQANQADVHAIMVWNPFVLQTLKTREGAKVLFDSTSIPGEIIDMVVVAKDSLEKPGGEDFACAVIDTFYQLNQMLEDPATGDDTLVALGAKFSSLGLEDMKEVVKQTVFYKTPDEATALYGGGQLPETMKTVVGFSKGHQMIASEPSIAFGAGDADLRFDTSFIEKVKAQQ